MEFLLGRAKWAISRLLKDSPFAHLRDAKTVLHLNHVSPSVVMGQRAFLGASSTEGLSGQRAASDLYGGHCAAAFSCALAGKDPFRLERSGALAARWIAKSLVAAGLCGRCEVQLTYSGAFDVEWYIKLFLGFHFADNLA